MRFPSVEQVGCETRQVQELLLPHAGQSRIGPIHTVLPDDEGNLYLSDEFNHSVFSLDSAGTLRWERAGRGSHQGQFVYPRGLACGRLSYRNQRVRCIAVADAWNRRVQFFDLSGQFLDAWQLCSGVSFGEVSDVYFLPADSDRGIWLVLDRGNHRICFLGETGRELGRVGRCLSPAISKRWSLPGCFVGWELDRRGVIPQFEHLDYLHLPWRLLGHSFTTLHVWEPYSWDLKRLKCGQLIPIPYRPETLSEWIGAFDSGLLGWDARNSRLLICGLDGKPHAAAAIAGVPIASRFPASEIWLQSGDRLRRIAIDAEELSRIASGKTVDAEAIPASAASEGMDALAVARHLLHFLKALVELADDVLRLTWPEAIAPAVSDSILGRLNVLSSRSIRVQEEFRALVHAWSVTILNHGLAVTAGSEYGENDASAREILAQWQRLAERLNCWRWRMVQRSDALLSVLEHGSLKESFVPDAVRQSLEQVTKLLNAHLALAYRFIPDFQPSDGAQFAQGEGSGT